MNSVLHLRITFNARAAAVKSATFVTALFKIPWASSNWGGSLVANEYNQLCTQCIQRVFVRSSSFCEYIYYAIHKP